MRKEKTLWGTVSDLKAVQQPVLRQQPMGHTAYHHVGEDGAIHPLISLNTGRPLGEDTTTSIWGSTTARVIAAAAIAAGAYHGYKRTGSAGWAVGWGVLAGLAPIIVIPIALAQGFAKRKGR
jgi:hypothetical protein